MNAAPRGLVRALVATLALGVGFVACASGSEVQQEPGGEGGSTGAGGFGVGGGATGGQAQGGGGGIPSGQIGGPCKETADCAGGNCTQLGNVKVCTQACPPACPAGTYCALVEGDPLCVPDLGHLCAPCNGVIDCGGASDQCLTAPPGDKFCARDCTTMDDCPSGFTCVEGDAYGPGKPAGGAGGGGGASGGAGQGGSSHPSGQAWKFCVPEGGASCGCSEARDGVEHACKVDSPSGSCTGTQVCDGKTGQWSACSAPEPTAESCNGKDDDCNGEVDDGDANAMCGGSPPPNTTGWGCIGGVCGAGPCKDGFTQFPVGDPKDGCLCQQELGEPNDECAKAYAVGKVTDTPGSTLTINGTLSSDTDVDVWSFDSKDVDEGTKNSYHLAIAFVAPAQNDEFAFDVIRGDTCADAPAGPAVSLTSYTWCVNGNDGGKGEGACGPQAAVHCTDHSSRYFLRVHRKAGAKGTCSVYTIKVTGTGDACDFSKQCPPE
jgi:hypothetical protein